MSLKTDAASLIVKSGIALSRYRIDRQVTGFGFGTLVSTPTATLWNMPGQKQVSDSESVAELIEARREQLGRPVTAGVSGYGGSGKTTLVRSLTEGASTMVRMRGDDFLDPSRSHRRSGDWDGVERGRLVAEVLAPFREGCGGIFRRYDWERRQLGEPEALPAGNVPVVDLIGPFHPEALAALDVTIWVDASLETAQRRGMQRGEALGRDFARLWHEDWVPNEIDFAANFSPRTHAELLYVP